MSGQRPFDILVIDADSESSKLVERACRLGAASARVKRVSDGLQALDHLETFSRAPDLLFMDLNLPGVDGRRVLHILRTIPALSTTPVVVVTASTETVDAELGSDLRVEELVRKPLDEASLKRITDVVARTTPRTGRRNSVRRVVAEVN